MNYQEALEYLYSFLDSEAKLPQRPAEFNLPRTRAVLDLFGVPDRGLRCVVVAGTKGKGSTSVMLEAIVRAAGYHTGLWTSPHLHSYRERIQVDRVPITREELAAKVAHFRPLIDTFDSERYGRPSVFELGFALALHTFAEQRVDVAILEVGLGGRYDSANAVEPILSLITKISYDHMHILGDTLAKIAYEKAGIMRGGVPVATVCQHPEAMAVIEQVSLKIGAHLVVAGEQATPAYTLGLAGAFQQENAQLAVLAAQVLHAQGFVIDQQAITQGLARANWPGRFEVIEGAPTIVLDGAHNGDSARQLIASLHAAFPAQRLVLIFGTTRDKDLTRMFAELLPFTHALVLTHSRHPRAETSLHELAAQAESYAPNREINVVLTDDVPEALDRARELATAGDVVVVTGSLFVVAAAREVLGLADERD